VSLTSQLGFEHFRAILPGKDPDFEEKLKSLVERSRAYVRHYLSEAVSAPGDPRIMARRRYREVTENDHEMKETLLAEHNKWERNCTMLLFNCVHALNEFADSVRKELRPGFFVRKGKFCVHDFMGMMGGSLVETWHIPDKFYSEDELSMPLTQEGE
jgi:hypothetical protein